MPDVTKLPKWAQQEIHRLERDLEGAKAKLAAGPENSNTFADPYGTSRPLGDSPTIEFKYGDEWHERFHVRLEAEKLLVSGGDSIAVLPYASNLIKVIRSR